MRIKEEVSRKGAGTQRFVLALNAHRRERRFVQRRRGAKNGISAGLVQRLLN